MKVVSGKLFDDRAAGYTGYLIDNSEEIHQGMKRPVIVVCPGGGYWFTSDREADPIALKYLGEGFHTFVLRYSTGEGAAYPLALQELSKLISVIRSHADEWMIDPEKIIGCGFSAGGHLAASLGVLSEEACITDEIGVKKGENKLNALVLGYPALSLIPQEVEVPPEIKALLETGEISFGPDPVETLSGQKPTQEDKDRFNLLNYVSENVPPSFVWNTYTDALVPFEDSITWAIKLEQYHVPVELHVFSQGNHGLSLANEETATKPDEINDSIAEWFPLSVKWLKYVLNVKLVH
ncbi:MAG: alpha/beta hydrolase [Hespellia sp.]|nr:alpha/beta hydrolase [Hespellia sp.]